MINLKSTGGGGSVKFKAPYSIGQAAEGGKIAYILQPGDSGYDAKVQHGLVAQVADIGYAPWGCYGTIITGTSNAIGAGPANTAAIVAQCSEEGTAAKLCTDLVEGGYSDWYLPSQGELTQLYNNRVAIGGFANAYYWNSVQNNIFTSTDAEFIYFFNGYNYRTSKNGSCLVRAIRSF